MSCRSRAPLSLLRTVILTERGIMAKRPRPVRKKRPGAVVVLSPKETETIIAEIAAITKELRRLNNLIEKIRKAIDDKPKKKGT